MAFIYCRTHDEVTSGFYVEADKGFNFSQWDESFVCQKKNHFQVRYCKQSIKRHHYMTQYNRITHYTITVYKDNESCEPINLVYCISNFV